MRCNNCGNEVTTEGTNCPFCGFPLYAGYQQPQGQTGQQAQGAYQQQGAQYGQGTGFQQQGTQYGQNVQQSTTNKPGGYSMDPKTAAIVCYLTWIGLVIALLSADRSDPFFRFHLNNVFVLIISGCIFGVASVILVFIPILGWLAIMAGSIFLTVCLIMGLINAINGECKPLPLLGSFKIFK